MTIDDRGSILEYYASDRVAEKYVSTASEGLRELEREAIDRYFGEGESRVLDVGCGTGRTTDALERLGYDVVGVDLTPSFVERARANVPDVPFFVGDVCALPFEDASFGSALFAYNGIDDVAPEEDRYAALREIHRVLEPGGVFTFSSHNLWSTYVPRSPDLAGIEQFVEFWVRNVREGRLGSRYKSDNTVTGGPRPMYYIRPADQLQQLRNCGFEVVDVLRTDGLLESRVHHPHYVARKPA